MKRFAFSFVLQAFVTTLMFVSCTEKKRPDSKENNIVLGKVDSLFSKSINEQRKFWVYVPDGAKPSDTKKYPVVYLLDGDAHFYSVAGLIHQLSSVNGNSLVPKMIVVAIPNTDRTRDLTPSNDHEDRGSEGAGGAENFTSFIKELIPYIEEHYPATPYRTLIGHSFGGLFTINTLMHHRELFNNYLAIDPSMWWDRRKLLNESRGILDSTRFDGKFLFVAEAHTVKKGMSSEELMKDTTELTRHMRSIVDFIELVKSKGGSGITFDSKYYPEDGHSSVVMLSEHDGLRAMFKWFSVDPLEKYYRADSKEPAEEVIESVKKHYATVSDHFGYTFLPPEDMVNEMGYYFMDENRPDRAYVFFKLNAENYPQEKNVYRAMGDYYIHEKDTTKAIDNYTKALAIEDDKEVREKLDVLKKSTKSAE